MSAVIEEWTAEVVTPEEGITRLRQLHRHRPDEGSIGDCYRTAIACLLGLTDPAEVPHFVAEDGGLPWEHIRLARAWLRGRDLDLLFVELEEAKQLGVPHIVTVHSRSGPWKHVVIAQNGRVVHCPMGHDYTLADRVEDTTVEILTRPYLPDPDEMVRRWREDDQ